MPSGELKFIGRIIEWGLFFGIIAWLYTSFAPHLSLTRRLVHKQADAAQARANANQTATAIKAYVTAYGSLPVGDNAEIMAALMGDNPRPTIFFERAAIPKSFDAFNAKGELIDPWDTPYRFDLSDPKQPRIWSCGKNRQDDGGVPGSDDVVIWR